MAWTGYNTSSGLSAIVGNVTTWSTTSKPHTLAQIEEINEGIYLQINAFLRARGVDQTLLTAEDQKTLGLINSLWAAAIIEPARFVTVNKDGSKSGAVWDKLYKDMLDNFVAGKAALSNEATTSPYKRLGLADTTIADSDPKFSVGDEY